MEKYNRELIKGPDKPEVCDLETDLAHALRTVLEWPLPDGMFKDAPILPRWLINNAVESLDRFYTEHET